MAYVTQSEIQTQIPAPFLNDALDDDTDGTADAGLLDQIIAQCSTAVDAYLSGIFTTPFPASRSVTSASRSREENVATVIFGVAHGFPDGQIVTLSGISGAGYNLASVPLTVIDAETVSYPSPGDDESATADTGGAAATPGPPPAVREAAMAFSCERIYDRRPVGEKNPWRKRADFWRDRLEKIGDRQLPLDSSITKSVSPGAVITEDVSADSQST